MTALVVYDSDYGNTERIAKAIAETLGAPARPIADLDVKRLPPLELLVVGSPTQGGRATADMQDWLARLSGDCLAGARVASFDTRMAAADQNFALRALMGVIGYAAPRILRMLSQRGGIAAAESAGFVVEGREGPLRAGEIERATRWAKTLVA